jgi:hypothetical protein
VPVIKQRPKVRLLLPGVVHPGQRLSGAVLLEARREVRIEQVSVQLGGRERSVVGSGKNATRSSRRVLALAAVLAEARTLSPGTTRYPFELELPAGLPPSYSGRRANVEYTLRATAPIAWWPDARSSFRVVVTPAPVEARSATPRLYASDPGGPRGRERHLECSLSDDAVFPGQPLRGSVALFNVAFHKYRELQLSFVATERAFTKHLRRSSSTQRARLTTRIPLANPAEGAAIPFSLVLPEGALPSVESELWSYSWELEVRAEIPWARDLVLGVPLTVLPLGSSAARESETPAVGTARVNAIWRAVAAEHGLRFEAGELRGEVAGVAIAIAREHRGAAGIFLRGTLRWPGLGLMLDGGQRSGFRRLFHTREVALDEAWSKDHYLTGREEAQVRSFGEAFVPALATLEGLVDLDDEGLRAERRDSGQARAALSDFAVQLLHVARWHGDARAAIPPPASMREAVPRWQALAHELGGRLELGPMAILGATVDGLAAEAVTDWAADGTPQRTRAAVTPALPLAAERQLDWLAGGEELLPPTGALPTEAAVLVQELAQTARAIAIREDRLELVLEAPLLDPAPIAPILRKLATLATLLGPRSGPYR